MKKCIDGVEVELTAEEISEIKAEPKAIPYEKRVVNRIRERYSVDDELALLRQRVLKSEEFKEYFEFVEQIKNIWVRYF